MCVVLPETVAFVCYSSLHAYLMHNIFLIGSKKDVHIPRILQLLEYRPMQKEISVKKLLHLLVRYWEVLKGFLQRCWNYGKFTFILLIYNIWDLNYLSD